MNCTELHVASVITLTNVVELAVNGRIQVYLMHAL